MTLGVELIKNDSIKCRFLKSFSKATEFLTSLFGDPIPMCVCKGTFFWMKVFYIYSLSALFCMCWMTFLFLQST